jgi:hypothetical protein
MVTWSVAALATTHIPHTIPALSTDAIIVLATALVFVYGLVAGYTALVRESISVYVGLVLANSFGSAAYQAITHGADNRFPVTQTEVQLLLLIAPIVILQLTRRHGHSGHKHNLVVTALLAALASMLVISSVLSQLSQTELSTTLLNSNLASWIYDLRLLWLAAVPVAIGVTAIFHPKHRAR